jgi:uncharacterized membrane protein YphA (DoxX/SURF4 family)
VAFARAFGVPFAGTAVAGALALELAGGVSLMLGRWPRLVGAALGAYLVILASSSTAAGRTRSST